MSNQAIIINQANLYLNFSGKRLTELPDTGVIASIAKATDDATVTGGLHGTVIGVINPSEIYTVIINVAPFSYALEWFQASRNLTRLTGAPHSLNVSYALSKWSSSFMLVQSIGVQEFNADTASFVPVTLSGRFEIANVVSFTAPAVATPADIQALIA